MKPIATPAIESVELPNRVKPQYVEQGDPSGIPVVLLARGSWCIRAPGTGCTGRSRSASRKIS